MKTPKNRQIRILPLLALCLFFLSGCAAVRHKTPVTELSQLNDASRTIGVARRNH